jgi:ankyrin repeat protein
MKQETTYLKNFPYHLAALNGDMKTIQGISSSEINETDERGLTPLHVAILGNQIKCALFLIENGADVNVQTTVILSSNGGQDRDRVKSVFNGDNATEWHLVMPFDSKVAPLHLASAFGLDDVVVSLLGHKAKVNQKSNGGALPIHYAALQGHGKIVDILLDNKSKLDAKIKSQSVAGWFDADMTILHAAAQSGNCGTIKKILEKGCSVSEYTKGGCGVLFFAARSGNPEAVKLLLEAGAVPQTDDPRYFNDPLNEIILRGDVHSAALLIPNMPQLNGIEAMEAGRKVFLWQPPIRAAIRYQNTAMIELLLEAGASRPVYDKVEDALYWGDLTEVMRFFTAGKKPDGNRTTGYSILFEAVEKGHYELVKFLLDQGYDENISQQETNSRHKNTPLHIAAMGIVASSHPLEADLYQKRSYLIAEVLLQKGANPNAVNVFGKGPIFDAIQQKNNKMVELLRQYGAMLT